MAQYYTIGHGADPRPGSRKTLGLRARFVSGSPTIHEALAALPRPRKSRWDGSGTHTFLKNTCRTEIPAGAWD